jgi:DNA (cytosine-5)-methyltransferase 1
MKGGTLFSGIGAPETAMPEIDWRWRSEIDPFANAVAAARHPHIPNLGNAEEIDADAVEPVDLLVFGSPCQSFSVAGKRGGLDDARGNLTLVGFGLAGRLRPRWVVWENVPGVLSDDGGRTFGAVLGLLGQLGYGFAYRVLDAQHFGVPQRRRRVFVVGHLGDWRPAAAVLFEPESLSGNPPPRREAGQGVTGSLAVRAGGGGWPDGGDGRHDQLVAGTIQANGKAAGSATQQDAECGLLVSHSLRADGFDASEDGTGRGTPLVPVAFGISSDAIDRSGEGDGSAAERAGLGIVENVSPSLRARANNSVATASAVRRLTPRECERLQGFPDYYTLVPLPLKKRQTRVRWAADGPRYRALGNSMAVPVMRWLLGRVVLCDDALRQIGRAA